MAWGDLQWGSCQYDTIADMYNKLMEFETLEQGCEALDIKVSFDGIIPFKELKDKILVEIKEESEQDDDWEHYWRPKYETLEVTKNLDELFCAFRDSSEDLWYTLRVAEDIFTDLVIEDLPEHEGVGPVLNVLAQTDNYKLGVIAYLLMKHDLIKDLGSFKNFDT